MLPLLVIRIIAMLADEQYAIDGQPIAAQRQSLPDGGVDGHIVLFGLLAAHIVFRYLSGVHRNDLRARARRLAVLAKSFEIFANDDIGVGVVAILGHNGSDALGRHGLGS